MMGKKTYIMLCLVIILFSWLLMDDSSLVSAKTNNKLVEYKYSKYTTFRFDKSKGEIVRAWSTGNDKVVKIPDKIAGVSVTSVGANAYSDCGNVVRVVIPESVKSIGESAFSWCRNLTSVTLPNNLKSIGIDAFSATALKSLKVPDSVEYLGHQGLCYFKIIIGKKNQYLTSIDGAIFDKDITKLIMYASNDKEFVIPQSVKEIGEGAFEYNEFIENVIIPQGVTKIGNNAFADTRIESIIIPDSVKSIGDSAFISTFLSEIVIPDSVTDIGNSAFRFCNYLNSVTLSNSLTHISDYAFDSCDIYTLTTNDTSYVNDIDYPTNYSYLPMKLDTIGQYAFAGNNFDNLIIPNSVTYIADNAFIWNHNIDSVYFCGNAPSIGKDVFESGVNIFYIDGCSGFTSRWNGLETRIWDKNNYNEDVTP